MFPDVTRDDVFRMDSRRLWLRWPRAADASALLAWSRSDDLHALVPALPTPDAAEIERFVLAARADNAAGASLFLIVTQKGAGRPPIGAVALRAGVEPGRLELAIVIAPSLRRRGFAAEVLTTLLPAVFGLTSCSQVVADVRAADAVARRLLQRCDFQRMGETRMRLDRRTWQQHHAIRRIPAMTHQISRYANQETSTAEA